MRLKRAIIKHTDQIHNWQGGGHTLSWGLMHFLRAKSHSRHLAQPWLHCGGWRSWQGIGRGTARTLWGRGEEWWGREGNWGLCLAGPIPPATSPLSSHPSPPVAPPLTPHPSSSTSPGGLLHYGSLTHRRDDPGNLIMHTTKVCPPTATTTRTTAAATLNLTASRPPLMHLHTEDRPNKVINQRPIFKWFAGRLKPLHTLPRVNSPTCRGADTHSHQWTQALRPPDTLDINIYPAPLHCRRMNYPNISIYICLYLICLRQTNCLGYKAWLSWHPKVTAHTERGGQFEYCT